MELTVWEKYIHQNSPGKMDCQLVTAINAYYYLTGKQIRQESTKYNNLIKLCGADHGSATIIEKVHQELGMEYADHDVGFTSTIPFEVHIWHKAYGFHSVLVVDSEPVTNSYRVANFGRVTNLKGWIFAEDLRNYWRLNPDNQEPRHKTRGFKLI